MSTAPFNQNATQGFANHAQALKAIMEAVAGPSLDVLDGVKDALGDESKAEQLVQDQSAMLKKIIGSLRGLSTRIDNSTGIDAAKRDALVKHVDSVATSMGYSIKMIELQQRAAKGQQPQQQEVMKLISDIKMAQINVRVQQTLLFEALYGFKQGQTLADVKTSGDLSIEDFERANAMISYSANVSELLERTLESMQYGDMSVAAEMVDLIDGLNVHLTALKNGVATSTSMDAQQKNVCLASLAAARNMNTIIRDGMMEIYEGNLDGAVSMLEGVQKSGPAAVKATRAYLTQLDQHYQAKAAANTAQPAKKPKGPGAA